MYVPHFIQPAALPATRLFAFNIPKGHFSVYVVSQKAD